MRSVATGYHIMVERQGKAPLDSGESTRATSNGVNLLDAKDNTIGCRCRFSRHYGRISRITAVRLELK